MTTPLPPEEPHPTQPGMSAGGNNPPPRPEGSTPWTAGPGPYGPPASYPYSPGSEAPYTAMPGSWGGQEPSRQGTDGVSVAALVTGLLQTGPIAVVLGIIGLGRVKRSGRAGTGMAIAGIVLGGITTVVGIIVAIFAVVGAADVVEGTTRDPGREQTLDRLWESCDDGDMSACDDLYRTADRGSKYEEFGGTCGGRTDVTRGCEGLGDEPVDDPVGDGSYGDDPELDALWDSCEAGDMGACDDLYMESGFGSEYEEFGDTCGGRTDGGGFCDRATDDPVGDGGGDTYGDNPELDALWDSCEAGDMGACDDLYMESDFGSEYEEFGDTCGGRTDGGPFCVTLDD